MIQHDRFRKFARRRQQRGAVLLEGVIVVTALVILLAGGVFLHRVYVQKLKLTHEARLSAWTQAMSGCSSINNPIAGVYRMLRHGDPVDLVIGSRLGVSASTAAGVTTAPKQLGGFPIVQASVVTVACNEKPQSTNGDWLDLTSYVRETFLPGFSGLSSIF